MPSILTQRIGSFGRPDTRRTPPRWLVAATMAAMVAGAPLASAQVLYGIDHRQRHRLDRRRAAGHHGRGRQHRHRRVEDRDHR